LATKRNRKADELDCVAVKRRAQRKIMAATKGMSAEQEVAYLERRVAEGPFAELWARIRGRHASGARAKGRNRAS